MEQTRQADFLHHVAVHCSAMHCALHMDTGSVHFFLTRGYSDRAHSMEHWDVSTAFIHAPLKEQVWMRQASGHEVKGKKSWVCLLLKALYGTAWQQHLKQLMLKEGFTSLILDPATYIKRQGNAFVIVGTHVDDLFVVSNSQGRKMKESRWAHLSANLAIKTLGETRWTLQMLIQQDVEKGVLKVSQESFVTEVLHRFNMTNCKSMPTPATDAGAESIMTEADLPATPEAHLEIADLRFLEVIGCLWWLAHKAGYFYRIATSLLLGIKTVNDALEMASTNFKVPSRHKVVGLGIFTGLQCSSSGGVFRCCFCR